MAASHPDATAAFEADTENTTTDVEALRARIRELEARDTTGPDMPPTPEAEAPDTTDLGEKFPLTGRIDTIGFEFRYRAPSANAITAFGIGAQSSSQIATRTLGRFFELHLHPDSYEAYMSLMLDPDAGDDTEDLTAQIVNIMGETVKEQQEATQQVRH